MRDIGVLVLVDQDIAKPRLVLAQHLRVRAEQADRLEQEVAEIGGVERLQPRLIGGIEPLPASIGEGGGLARGDLLGGEAAVLPAVDLAREHARGPALLVDVLRREKLLQEPDLVVGVENGEIGLEPDQFGMTAEDLRADRVEGAEPGHAFDDLADHVADPPLHLARRLVGEGDAEDFRGARPPCRENMGDPRGQHPRLAGARAGEHQHRALQGFHRLALLRIEPVEIGRAAPPLRPRRDSARGKRRRVDVEGWRRTLVRLGHSGSRSEFQRSEIALLMIPWSQFFGEQVRFAHLP